MDHRSIHPDHVAVKLAKDNTQYYNATSIYWEYTRKIFNDVMVFIIDKYLVNFIILWNALPPEVWNGSGGGANTSAKTALNFIHSLGPQFP